MTKYQAKKRKQDLGIFYTPPEVVEFIYEILSIWKNKDAKKNHRWQYKKPKQHYPSVIDPACGEGIFLKKAVDSGFTTPSYIWGVDLDEKVKEKWKKITLLKSFGSKANLDFHFYHQDGLLPIPEKRVGHKKGGMNQYDAVVGNPPYGGMGIGEITKELEESLFEYEIWKKAVQKQSKEIITQLGLMENSIKNRDKERLKKFPIEILFLDRFIQLAKPGGWIVIIIPDGILTNSNSYYVREFISKRAKVEAIVSLPRDTFKNAGTNAKTSILFLRKLDKEDKPKNSYPVFMASIEEIKKEYFNETVISYEKFYNLGENHMSKSDLVQIIPDQNKREAVMVRVDKTLKQLIEEKPSSRWDPLYWHPKFEDLMKSIKVKWVLLEKYILDHDIAFPDCVRESRGESLGDKYPTYYFRVSEMLNTGYDWVEIKKCSDNAAKRLSRTKVLENNVIIARSGVTLGSTTIISNPPENSCTGDLFVLNFNNSSLNPYYFTVLMHTKYGKAQFLRFWYGTGSPKISVEHIRSLRIPVLSNNIQKFIENDYRKMSTYHNMAMESKKKGDKKEYKENLEIAEKMLKDLIKKTEEVIEGKREDVN